MVFKRLNRIAKKSLKQLKKVNTIPICILVLIVLGGLAFIHFSRSRLRFFEGNENMKRDEGEFMFLKMNGCGHCKSMQGEWDELKSKPVAGCKFGEYEASKDKDIMKKYNVNSFPTLILLPKEGKPIPYEGDRKASAMRSFIVSNL